MRRRFLALGAVMTVAAAACSSPSHRADPPTTPRPPATSAAPVGPNPDVVPTVITPAYVDAVFAVLDHLDGDASRELLKSGSVSDVVRTDLRAIFNDPLYAQELEIAGQSLHGDLTNVRRPPGDTVISVVRLISASPTCVFVQTQSDYSAVLVHVGKPVADEYWALKPKASGDDPNHLNPTPWSLSFNADFLTPTSIPNQCGV